jgi:uncharacterized damage-inducible protein DinB
MIPFFKELFEYNHHFNQKLASVFSEEPDKIPEKSIKWFSHILNAHRVWNSRILPVEDKFGVWQMHEVNELMEIDRTNYIDSLKILDRENMESEIQYLTSKGDPFTNTVRDILFHVINHSTYHRGQIAADFRQHNLEPIVSDYIFYKR